MWVNKQSVFAKQRLGHVSGDDLTLLLLINALADGAMLAYRVAVCRGVVTESRAGAVVAYLERSAIALRANGLTEHAERFLWTAEDIRNHWWELTSCMHGFANDYARMPPESRDLIPISELGHALEGIEGCGVDAYFPSTSGEGSPR